MLKGKTLLFKYLFRYKRDIFIGLLILLFVDAIQLFIPQIIKSATDGLYRRDVDVLFLLKCAGLIILLNIFIYAGRYLWRYFIMGSSLQIEKDLRRDLFEHLLKMDITFYHKRKIGDLMAYATNDVLAITRFCGMGLVALFDATILLVSAIGFMFYISPKLTFYILIPLPFLSLFIRKAGRFFEKNFRISQRIFGEIMDKAREYLKGIMVIKSYGFEDEISKRFSNILDDYKHRRMKLIKVDAVFDPIIKSMIFITTSILIYFGGRDVIFNRITLGEFVAFNSYLNLVIWPIMAVGLVVNLFNRAMASVNRLNEIFSIQLKILNPVIYNVEENIENISVNGISFCYSNCDKNVIDNINFSISKGEKVGIIGMTGCGKSTLFSLLIRLLQPDKGNIFYNDIDINKLSKELISKHIFLLTQTPYIFSDTIRNNLLVVDDTLDDESLKRALKYADLFDELEEFKDGLNTVVGERGITLSGGQKQRLAIARLFLLKKDFYFIDDALSACDADTEWFILNNLFNEFKNSGFLISTMRIRVLKLLDRIIVMNKGKIVAQGFHDDLIKSSDIFREIVELQRLKEDFEHALS